MFRDKGRHEAGKHERRGEPEAGGDGRKPEITEVIMRWPNGAIQERQTRNVRQGR